MTIFVSIDCDTGILKRFDASKPEGLTHVGRLTVGLNDDRGQVEAIIRDFYLFPPDALATKGETKLLPPPKEVRA